LNENSRQRRVLVIDDEPAIRSLLADLLTVFFGVDVDAADSGAAALTLFGSSRYELVLTDLRLPDIDGWELIGRLRRQKPETRVIMLTGSATAADARRAREVGVTLVTKPASIEHLKRVIEQVLSVNPSPGTLSEAPDHDQPDDEVT
jgi:DNA-binding response OmpR family regulator